MNPARETIPPERLQQIAAWDGLASQVVLVDVPGRGLVPKLRLWFQFRRLGPPPPGNGPTIHQEAVVGLEFAQRMVDHISSAIADAKQR